MSILFVLGFGMFLFVMVAVMFYRWYKSGSMLESSSIAMSSVSVAVGTLLSEFVDILTDVIACIQVLDEGYASIYAGLTILAGVTFVLGFIERITNLRWQMRRYRNKQTRKRENSNRVGPDHESERESHGSAVASADEDDLAELEYDIKGIYTRGLILVGEDLPMLFINTSILATSGKANLSIVLSLVVGAVLTGAKLMALKFLGKLKKERLRLKEVVEKAKEATTPAAPEAQGDE